MAGHIQMDRSRKDFNNNVCEELLREASVGGKRGRLLCILKIFIV